MKALIIAAHGSRKKESNLEVASLCARVAKKAGKEFEKVDHAFLQFADPILKNKIDELVETGVKQIVIFPFFTGSGSHILVDIPELVKKAQSIHKHVSFKVTRHLGKIEEIADVILHKVMT